jgi:hypothetical protein
MFGWEGWRGGTLTAACCCPSPYPTCQVLKSLAEAGDELIEELRLAEAAYSQ